MSAPLPAGAVDLTADQLAEILQSGDHPEPRADSETDATLISLVRAGMLFACRLADGRIGFSR